MAISRWTVWGGRSNRPLRSRHNNDDDYVQLDLSKDLKDNIEECLINICQRFNVTNVKKLAYLNAFVKLISESETLNYGYTLEELLCCLRVGLVHDTTQVRAATLRTVRYLLKSAEDVVVLNKLQYPYFIARSMDVFLRNEVERMQAVRLTRRILLLSPKDFSPALVRSLISLTNGAIEDFNSSKDRGVRVFLAALCEVGVLNSSLLIKCGGLNVLTRATLVGQSPGMVESVIGVILKLLANPETRKGVSLMSLASPYCELEKHEELDEKTKTDRLETYTASKIALLSVLRSYSGVIHFCHPNNSAGLKAIVDILYVEQLEVRGAILELFYELLGLTLPAWTDEPDVALAAVDPSRYRNSWKLNEGFVAAEGENILPSLMSRRPNITEIHLALLVFILLECGLHRALAEIIVTSDTFISVRAAVLLGALLHFAHTLLPPEVCDLAPSLPNLLEHASAGKHQALTAVAILERIHTMMRRKPNPASLFLDRLLQASTWLRPTQTRRSRSFSIRNWLKRESPTTPLLKDTQVLISKDARLWNWQMVRSILRTREDSMRTLNDSDHKLFVEKLVRYFKPSSNSYCRVELATNATLAREATLAGCDLMNFLIECQEPEGTKLLNELVEDIAEQIAAIESCQSAHDCLFSPRQMSATCCQKYFLFLGQMSHSPKGMIVLRSFNLLEKMQNLAIRTNHDCYIKLIVSSLDYSRDGTNRKVLSKIISDAKSESARLYAIRFLRLIVRAKMIDTHAWIISALTGRLLDSSRAVALAALEILNESCEEVQYLEALMQQVNSNRDTLKWLENLGDHGYLLKVRLYSLKGFCSLSFPLEELEKWVKSGGYAERYVGLVESEIHDSLTRRQKNDHGNYIRRITNMNLEKAKDVFVPPHLIGQFVQHDLGMQLLLRRNVIHRFTRVVQRFKMEYANVSDEVTGASSFSAPGSTEDSFFLPAENVTDDIESNRLQTIIDSEIMDTKSPPLKKEPFSEMRRKFSFDDSRRTTPERSWKMEPEPELLASLNSNLEAALMKVKSALWLLGHVGTSMVGVEHLNNLGIVELMTSMAETCPYYSVRATAMYALSLIATTKNGADVLTTFDWPCVRHLRGDQFQVTQVVPNPYPTPTPSPVQRHHRSLSDGKPELPEPIIRRTRNRSESAATDLESRKYALLYAMERGETPSPGSSIHRLSQQDAEGYAKLRSLQRHRRPSYSQSSLEMYSLDGRLSLQSLSEFESSRSCIVENTPSTPPLQVDQLSDNEFYMGISLPKKLTTIFPNQPPQSLATSATDEKSKSNAEEATDDLDDSFMEYDEEAHHRICMICHDEKFRKQETLDPEETKIHKEILKNAQRLSNPLWYRHSRQNLLRLRQKYPEKFQDACIFSEVASQLENNTYRLLARRFLQELFWESHFDSLYAEPLLLLNMTVENKEVAEQTKPTPKDTNGGENESNDSVELKINGRMNNLNIPGVDKLGIVTEEMSGDTPSVGSQNQLFTSSTPVDQQRQTDEKIIAEILKPEERLRVSRNPEKIFKGTEKTTAISFD